MRSNYVLDENSELTLKTCVVWDYFCFKIVQIEGTVVILLWICHCIDTSVLFKLGE